MNGLFLQGGGAKGAFQAGALYALNEENINFEIVSGTSMGAINGYYLYKDNLEIMKEIYTNPEKYFNAIENKKIKLHKVVDNSLAINMLKFLSGENKYIKSFYVNYTEIFDNKVCEKIVDVCKMEDDEVLKAIKYSSLLPCSFEEEENSLKNVMVKFKTEEQFLKLKHKIEIGEYNGYKLDGGVINNCLLKPFEKNKVDKLYLICLDNEFEVPDYLKKVYKDEEMVLIKRDEKFSEYDTLNFTPEFLKQIFYEGYDKAKLNINR